MEDGTLVSFVRSPRTPIPALVGRWRGQIDYPAGAGSFVSTIIDTNLVFRTVILSDSGAPFSTEGVFVGYDLNEKTLHAVFTSGSLPVGTFQYSRFSFDQNSFTIASSAPNTPQYPPSVENPGANATRVRLARETN